MMILRVCWNKKEDRGEEEKKTLFHFSPFSADWSFMGNVNDIVVIQFVWGSRNKCPTTI